MSEYLRFVTGGREVSLHLVEELQNRYAAIGLSHIPSSEGPHLTRWTLGQAAKLRERLNIPVYVGMRNGKPFIPEVVETMRKGGIEHVTVICLAPQNSRTSIGLFKRAIEAAAAGAFHIHFVSGWAEHPALIRAFAEKIRPVLSDMRIKKSGHVVVLFTAHSVPARCF
jgi:ferrochelatase